MSKSGQTRRVELSESGFNAHALRRVRKLNDTLRKTRELVERFGDHPGESLALLVAETRVLVLRASRYEFAQLAKMHFHAVKNVETPGSQPQHESLSRVYRAWTGLLANKRWCASANSQMEEELSNAANRLLDLLVLVEDDYGRPFRNSVEGLYWKWTYQVGRNAFAEASKRTNRQHRPLTYGTIWQRHEVQMVPDFEEVRIIGRALDRDLDEASAIWSQQKSIQLEGRGIASPLVRLIVAMQQQHDGLRMTAASIRHHCGVALKVAQAIKKGQMVSFDGIQHVVDSVIPRRERASFARQWKACQPRDEDFSTAFPRIRTENGWTNHMIARLLEVRAPEHRASQAAPVGRRKNIPRVEAFRPSAEVRRMYQENAFSSQAPAKAAIELVAGGNSIINDLGETQKDYLTRLFLEGAEEQLRKKGNGGRASELRKHRILCGVTPEILARLAGEEKQELLLAERGLRIISSRQRKRLINLTHQYVGQKLEQARRALARLTADPQTVTEAVTLLKERHGGYIPLSRVLQDEEDRRLSFTPGRLKRIEFGEEVPPLPLLKRLVARGGSHVTSELVRDWYVRMPAFLAARSRSSLQHPLARGFGMVVFERWLNLKEFWKEHFESDFSHSVLTRNFQQLNGRGYDVAWTTVSRYLNAAGVGIADPRRLFWQRLFEQREEIAEAIQAKDDATTRSLIRNILVSWRKQVLGDEVDPETVEHRLGLMPSEYGTISHKA